jgi:transcription antitermination factor NusG
MTRDTDEQLRDRIASEERSIAAVRILCESYTKGGMSYGQTAKLIEDVLEDQAGRIVRVGNERHSPEVQT